MCYRRFILLIYVTLGEVKHMWNTMECKSDSFSCALGGARDTLDVFHVALI